MDSVPNCHSIVTDALKDAVMESINKIVWIQSPCTILNTLHVFPFLDYYRFG